MQNKEPNFNLSNSRLRLVSGTSNPKLAEEIASYLGIENVPLISKRFADGELYVQIQQSIRGCDVFLIQPTCAPVNDNLMELMIMVDACKRAYIHVCSMYVLFIYIHVLLILRLLH